MTVSNELADLFPTNLIEDALNERFGERCADFDPGCVGCLAWAELNALKQASELLERRTSQPVAWRHVLVHPDGYDFDWQVDQKPDHPYGLSDGYTAVTTPLFASPPSQGEPVAVKGEMEGTWRDLALQFDGHRIEALSMLLYAARSIEEYATARDILREPLGALKRFLAAPPLSGAEVLAARLRALSPAPSLAVSDEIVTPDIGALYDEMQRRMDRPKYLDQEGGTNPDWLPVDDTQVGIEFAYKFIRAALEAKQ